MGQNKCGRLYVGTENSTSWDKTSVAGLTSELKIIVIVVVIVKVVVSVTVVVNVDVTSTSTSRHRHVKVVVIVVVNVIVFVNVDVTSSSRPSRRHCRQSSSSSIIIIIKNYFSLFLCSQTQSQQQIRVLSCQLCNNMRKYEKHLPNSIFQELFENNCSDL